MSEIINPVRKTNAWGKEIEPEFVTRPVIERQEPRGVGIRLTGVEKSFGAVQVLKGIDLEVPAGQFLAIVGKSGCGKSTLLRLLVGLDEVTGGDIAFVNETGGTAKPIPFSAADLVVVDRDIFTCSSRLVSICGPSTFSHHFTADSAFFVSCCWIRMAS